VKQKYFIVVLAHSLHGRLRRIHVPHSAIYVVLALALIGCFSVFGFLSSYMRMVWKVANYNSLRQELDSLRSRYARLERSADETHEQLATLQMFASEVSLAYGIKSKLEGSADIASEGRLVPSFTETLEHYNFLKSASITRGYNRNLKPWRTADVRPSLWPVNGRLLSHFGTRNDPFSGERNFHAGVDISATRGTAIRATADGVVTHAEWAGAYGKLIIVKHGNLQTYYAHLSRIDVVEGQEVRRGEIIGASGGTGRATSPHLHYEVRNGNSPVNPYSFLVRSTVAHAAAPSDLPF
jgi:murein DD-endopeptidase MepM/ murein hydrolase activator NlpD